VALWCHAPAWAAPQNKDSQMSIPMVRFIGAAAIFGGAFIIGVMYNTNRAAESKQPAQGIDAEAGQPKTEAVQRKDCYGTLRDVPVVGIQIGQCDLSSISDKELKQITNVCGQPGGIGARPGGIYGYAPACRIEALVLFSGDDLFKVQKVLKVTPS
jgi:hypothetical protein